MTTRRTFLRSLGVVAGASGGLLLPWRGVEALTLPDLAKAADVPVSAVPLPRSGEGEELRSLRRVMLGERLLQDQRTYAEQCAAWRPLMERYMGVAESIAARPDLTWSDVRDLAEVDWHLRNRRGLRRSGLIEVALLDAVLSLTAGERFDPDEEYWRVKEGKGNG